MPEKEDPEDHNQDQEQTEKTREIPERIEVAIKAVRTLLQESSKPLSVLHPLMHLAHPGEPVPKKFKTLNTMLSHFAISMREIRTHNKPMHIGDKELMGAFNILSAVVMSSIGKWAVQHPSEAEAIEQTVLKRTKLTGHEEQDFADRHRSLNVTVVKEALSKWDENPTTLLTSLSPTVRPTLEAIRQSCNRQLINAEHHPTDNDNYYYYEREDHYYEFITYVYVRTLLETIEV